MSSWRDKYFQALRESEQERKANYTRLDDNLIEAFTNLLERTSALETQRANTRQAIQSTKPPGDLDPLPVNEEILQSRSDLAEAIRSNGQLHSRIKTVEVELLKLRAKTKSDLSIIKELHAQQNSLKQKLNDRDEELRGKTKLLDDVHDEVVALHLQLNLSEQRAKNLLTENKSLIDRWLIRKSHEADEMNKRLHD
ncbi:BgTH12-06892 [Blumeria graminis f. sp. triticale]|uniref:BgTH12-06892 n=1 Tax=Blumeria graminis f. sp. triticale TaxID=1689686 RepID=A0A9W4D6V8_BLUGR|nr:BgTH12-06892 [Blumeria graminis f. sp. triticale]